MVMLFGANICVFANFFLFFYFLFNCFLDLPYTERQMQQYIAEDILKGMDVKSLVNVQLVSQLWKDVVVNRQLWRKLIERYVRSLCC